MVWQLIVISIIGYLIGSINLSIILSKLMGKGDIREHGSGNAGTTNTLRVLGKLPALAVFIFDVIKPIISISIAKVLIFIGSSVPAESLELAYELAILLSAFATILGHDYPIYYGFKGGKGIATSLGAILYIEWPIGVVCLLFALVLIIASRMVSLGSIISALLYPVLVLVNGTAMTYTLPCVFALIKHRSNITRLLNGTENKIWKTKKEKMEESKGVSKQETKNN